MIKVIVNKQKETQAIAIGTTDEDVVFLQFLWDNKQLIGFYKFYIIGEKNKREPEVSFILQHMPDAKCIAHINNGCYTLRPPLKAEEVYNDGR